MANRSNNGADVTAAGPERPHVRKPYTPPILRRLGSVRDLTLGSTRGCGTETGAPKFPRKKM
jgi:hypothetical protein